MSAKKNCAVWHSRLSPTSFPEETTKKRPTDGDFSRKTATHRLKLLPVDIKKEKDVSINLYAASVCDYTMKQEVFDLPITPSLMTIKNRSLEYYKYDPNGSKYFAAEYPDNYCHKCLCPIAYCCDKVFGPMCIKHVQTIIERDKLDKDYDLDDIAVVFKGVYTEAVHAKMLFNEIYFIVDLEKKKVIELLRCVSRGSLRTLLHRYRMTVVKSTMFESVIM